MNGYVNVKCIIYDQIGYLNIIYETEFTCCYKAISFFCIYPQGLDRRQPLEHHCLVVNHQCLEELLHPLLSLLLLLLAPRHLGQALLEHCLVASKSQHSVLVVREGQVLAQEVIQEVILRTTIAVVVIFLIRCQVPVLLHLGSSDAYNIRTACDFYWTKSLVKRF